MIFILLKREIRFCKIWCMTFITFNVHWIMSQQSPRFNQVFVQPSPTKFTEYRFDLDRGESEAKELPEDIERKLIGFQSIDELFSSLHPNPKHSQLSNNKELPPLSPRPNVQQPLQKMPPTKKPNITINYKQPPQLPLIIVGSNTLSPSSPRFFERRPRVRKVIKYEERLVRVPVQREVIEYDVIEEVAEADETRPQPIQSALTRAKSLQTLPPKNTAIPKQNNTFIPNITIQEEHIRRFVTCERYSFPRRKQELQELQAKINQLKEAQKQIFK